ncbi:DUF4442 domain-containing protein [Neolewinella aurantiaca]|uniref:DUF4442 domain-containing protein n=1 Tax=Neolewinella aurantiaca TaxID=2602767 RepID=A0A5C7FI35_9BACT|nr:DUF4442 domain-containing protein [Neolewinella aurantiaca]TXF85954.1 DUF4442 domain-containing protein [Neolewinella aurantiaca]
MSFYQSLAKTGTRYFGKAFLFKHGFNLSPMYRRSTARITKVTGDMLKVKIRLPLSYKNSNYVGSIFGGSMFSAVDPIPMVQLINLLDENYVVWDKSAEISFRIPAREDLYAEFTYTEEELAEIKARIASEREIDIVKVTRLTDKTGSKVFCEVRKTVYVADKDYYREKRAARRKK